LFLRLLKNKFVQYEWIEAYGHPRKYYTLTREGMIALKQYEQEWKKLDQLLEKIKNNQLS
jgi:PadR family transcriptional regulator PadR